jgi:hypothetical protein
MKPSTLVWVACIILLLGQVLIFYTIVSPQLQSLQSLQTCQRQHVDSITVNTPDGADNYLTDLVNRLGVHIDEVAVIPSKDGSSRVVIVYHNIDPRGCE